MIVPTKRAVTLFAAAAPVALLGYVTPLVLDWLALFDAGLLLLLILDARRAVPPSGLSLEREAPDSFSIGRESECTYLWSNHGHRAARLLVPPVPA